MRKWPFRQAAQGVILKSEPRAEEIEQPDGEFLIDSPYSPRTFRSSSEFRTPNSEPTPNSEFELRIADV